MKYLWLIMCMSTLSLACSKKCSVVCGSGVSVAAIGYTFDELDSLQINVYTPNDSFNHLIHSYVIAKSNYIDYNYVPNWDTTGYNSYNDTLVNSNADYDIYAGQDFEVYVPSSNSTYKFSNIIYNGAATESVHCHGEYSSDLCFQFITSYRLNGNLVTVNPLDNLPLYFHK